MLYINEPHFHCMNSAFSSDLEVDGRSKLDQTESILMRAGENEAIDYPKYSNTSCPPPFSLEWLLCEPLFCDLTTKLSRGHSFVLHYRRLDTRQMSTYSMFSVDRTVFCNMIHHRQNGTTTKGSISIS